MSHRLNRRRMLQATGLGLFAQASMGRPSAAASPDPKTVLFFTKSSGFPHSVVQRKSPDALSHAESILVEIGKARGFKVVATKDGGMFESDRIGQFDAFAFYTTGDLTKAGTDGTPPITAEGEANLYAAIRGGKGFMGFHCATDTFGGHRKRGGDDPYIQLIGGHFAGHGAQQAAKLQIIDPAFPGASEFGKDSFTLNDEWYSQKFLAPDLHVVMAYVTESMKGNDYERPNYPQSWARRHGQGRVFYNSMGHREDVWTNPKFQGYTLGALDWLTGRVDADVTPNVATATPGYQTLGKPRATVPAAKKA